MDCAQVIFANVSDELLDAWIIGIVIAHDAANLDHLADLFFESKVSQRAVDPGFLDLGRPRNWIGLLRLQTHHPLCKQRRHTQNGYQTSKRKTSAPETRHTNDSSAAYGACIAFRITRTRAKQADE